MPVDYLDPLIANFWGWVSQGHMYFSHFLYEHSNKRIATIWLQRCNCFFSSAVCFTVGQSINYIYSWLIWCSTLLNVYSAQVFKTHRLRSCIGMCVDVKWMDVSGSSFTWWAWQHHTFSTDICIDCLTEYYFIDHLPFYILLCAFYMLRLDQCVDIWCVYTNYSSCWFFFFFTFISFFASVPYLWPLFICYRLNSRELFHP